MNKYLKGFMAMYNITYQHLSKELGVSTNTIGSKIRNGTFSQDEINILVSYFKKYDTNADYSIFFKK